MTRIRTFMSLATILFVDWFGEPRAPQLIDGGQHRME